MQVPAAECQQYKHQMKFSKSGMEYQRLHIQDAFFSFLDTDVAYPPSQQYRSKPVAAGPAIAATE
ncbi:MAG: hypothetical protein LBQ76_09265 [Candidatus Fibromonas sp.]|jgi:hypothetical protein|nr:hypothetical protein [Candidatus Fibromonas sp.]